MKIAIMGTGGVGGYYGGLLAQHGHAVSFIARGAHLQAIRNHGLQVMSIHGDFLIAPVDASDDPAQIGPVDLVLFCTKTYHTDEAARQIRPLIGPDTTVVSLQNGVDAAERIGAVIGHQHMIGGATWISSAIESPGVIRQVSQFRRVVLGELDGRLSARLQTIHQALEQTGISAELSDNILKVLWTKFVFIAAASSLGSLTRLPMGEYRSVPETRALVTGLMGEVAAVARAHAVALDQDVVDQALAFMDNAAVHIKASMQLDVAAGRRTEIDSMVGVIGRKGREAGIATPVADFVYAALLPVDLKARASFR
jgi:2-dehydropantoate 2-reductase